jgi:NADH pyrophosphatase NudC (nudix superfamily)
MTFLVAVLVSLGAIAFTLLVRGKDIPEAPPVSPVQHLVERKAQIYDNLRDLQFEYRVGKFSDEDYQKTKLDLQKELAKVLAEIDAIQPQQVKAAATAAPERKVKALNECPHCGAKFAQSMKFCGECGKAMA